MYALVRKTGHNLEGNTPAKFLPYMYLENTAELSWVPRPSSLRSRTLEHLLLFAIEPGNQDS